MKALKEITKDDYENLAQNGARILFELDVYRILDGVRDDEQSYFVLDISAGRWYLINMETCYELVTAFYCGGHKPYIKEWLNEIAFNEK